jgi:hypothetical protein
MVRHYNQSVAFIRTKRVKGQTYYYRVETYVDAGKIKQRVLRYLGKEIPEEYLNEWQKRGSRVESKTRNTHSASSVRHGEVRGNRHGREKTR